MSRVLVHGVNLPEVRLPRFSVALSEPHKYRVCSLPICLIIHFLKLPINSTLDVLRTDGGSNSAFRASHAELLSARFPGLSPCTYFIAHRYSFMVWSVWDMPQVRGQWFGNRWLPTPKIRPVRCAYSSFCLFPFLSCAFAVLYWESNPISNCCRPVLELHATRQRPIHWNIPADTRYHRYGCSFEGPYGHEFRVTR